MHTASAAFLPLSLTIVERLPAAQGDEAPAEDSAPAHTGDLTAEQMAEIREGFDYFDKQGDGAIKVSDLGTCLRCLSTWLVTFAVCRAHLSLTRTDYLSPSRCAPTRNQPYGGRRVQVCAEA